MKQVVNSIDVDRDWEMDLEYERRSEPPKERFRMTYSPMFRTATNRPQSFNGIHRRRRKKVRI
jgi:hypothetical protein